MKGWNELGVVGTIYEEEDYESKSLSSSITTSPISPHFSSSTQVLSPPLSLHSRVEEWSRVKGRKTDVLIRFNDQYFNLHKEPLVSRSRYLYHRLSESTDITVDPPSRITADTFTDVVAFCYDDSYINLTPSNLAAIKVVADWLEMGGDDGSGDGSLLWRTEMYFRQEIACDAGRAWQVMSMCVALLPDVTAALLAARCVEVLASQGVDSAWMEELTALGVEGFGVVAEAMRTWFMHDHDLLYRISDHYLLKNKDKVTEEEKSRICHSIDCSKLSHHPFLHLAQNPRLPLRFIVQAMLVDQLHTRHTFVHLSSSAFAKHSSQRNVNGAQGHANNLTLGAILQRDAALHEASHLRASMEATSFRIESLERDIKGMRRKLRWSEEKKTEMESVRASSFREVVSGKSCKGNDSSRGLGLGFGRKLMNGIKSVLKGRNNEGEKRMQKHGHMSSRSCA